MDIPTAFATAFTLHQAGNFEDARRIYEDIVRRDPSHFESLHLLGIMAFQQGLFLEAVRQLDLALLTNPGSALAHGNRGASLQSLKRNDEALASFDRALALRPDYAEAHNNRGVTLAALGRLDEALAGFDRAIALKPEFAKAHADRGKVLIDLQRYEDAAASFDRAIALDANNADTHNNRGVSMTALGRDQEALASHDRALALRPDYVKAHLDRASVLLSMRRYRESLASYDCAIALDVDRAEAHTDRGVALYQLGRHEEAIASFDRAISINPYAAAAHRNRGGALEALKRYEEAIASYDTALSCDPHLELVAGIRIHLAMHICEWSSLESSFRELLNQVDAGYLVSGPFPLFATPASPAQQQKVATLYFQHISPRPAVRPPDFKKHSGKIRVGYFSADFHDHATTVLIAGLLEAHDRSQFEITGFLLARRPSDAAQTRLKTALDRFVDVSGMSDQEVAELSHALKIDIAVDLKGYTTNSRPGIFARRAAPIQVNYLGYPGTMGTTCMDYIIADAVVVPPHLRTSFTEKVAYLPHSYQANDLKRPMPRHELGRAALGLPESGFVFCSFNNSYKLTPDVFDIWMRLLGRIEESVLWLLEDNETAAANLRDEAQKRGISPHRLIFAKRMAHSEHMARQTAADLFLDTFYCGAHTTASDALWAGLPVLTKLGDTFAGRVAASLLTALGLPELVAADAAAYERIAFELAIQPDKLAGLKQRLQENRLSYPLFDTPRFTRNIEAAYRRMWDTYSTDGTLDDFHVEDT